MHLSLFEESGLPAGTDDFERALIEFGDLISLIRLPQDASLRSV